MVDLYELLDVNKKAKKVEIKESYQKIVKKYTNTEENQLLKNLKEAKEILLDDEKREEYDKTLNNIKYSKQFSKEEEETYRVRVEEYKEQYASIYITGRELFYNYLKYGIENIVIKIIKSIIFLINFIFFLGIKGIIFGVIFLVYLASDIIDYIAGFVMILAVIALFAMAGEASPDYIPFIPANFEYFGILSIVVFIIEMLKHFVLDSSVNLFALVQNIEEKINVRIVMQ